MGKEEGQNEKRKEGGQGQDGTYIVPQGRGRRSHRFIPGRMALSCRHRKCWAHRWSRGEGERGSDCLLTSSVSHATFLFLAASSSSIQAKFGIDKSWLGGKTTGETLGPAAQVQLEK